MAQKHKQLRSSSRLLALEPRLLFDAGAMVAAQDAAQPDLHEASSTPDSETSPASGQEPASTSFHALFAQAVLHPEGSLKEAKNTSDDGAMTVGEDDAAPTSVLADWKVSGEGTITVTVTGQSDGLGTLSHTSTTGVLTFTGTADQVNQWLAGIQYQYTQDAAQQKQEGDSYTIALEFTTYNDKGEASTKHATQRVDIAPQNDATQVTPPANNAPHASIQEGGSFHFGAPETQANGKGFTHSALGLSDPDNSADQVIIKIDSLPDPSHGKLVLTRNGQEITLAIGSTLSVAELGALEYRATDAQILNDLTDHFTFTIDDGAGGRSSGHVVNIELTPLNQAPSVQGSVTIVEGESNVSLGAGGALTATRTDGSTFTVLSDRGHLAGQDVDDSSLTYQVTSLPSVGTLRYNGELLTADNIGRITMTDLNLLTYSYPAGSEPSDHAGKVSFGLKVTDNGGGEGKVLVSNSTVELTILENNDDPVLVNNAAQDYEALRDAQLVTDSSFVITTEMLSVSDPDSFHQNLVFKITDTTAAELGYFTIDGKLLAAGTSFTMADVEAGKVKYHLRTTTTDARTDSFNFQVIDSSTGLIFDAQGKAYQRDGGIYSDDSQKSGLKVFTFEVKVPAAEPGPGGDLPALPDLAQDLEAAGSMRLDGIKEGQGTAADSGSGMPLTEAMLHTTDSKTPANQIIYRLETLPISGTLMLAGKALGQFDSFTQQDINEGRVKFVHSGGEQFSDAFQFSVSNGTVTTSGLNTFHITAIPQNDTPVASQGEIPNVMEGQDIRIEEKHILLSDRDQAHPEGGYANDNALWFVVTRLPQHGTLLLNGQAITSDTRISEADLKAGHLVYRHNGSENFKDNFEIQPYDNQNVGTEPTGSTNQSSAGEKTVINITIASANDAPVFSGQQDLKDTSSGQHALQEGGKAPIYGNTIPQGALPPYGQLVFTDSDNSAAQIQYRVTEAPRNGQLLLNGTPLGAGSVFTQADLDAGRISYQHNGGERHSDSFKYTVSDGDYRVNDQGDGSTTPGSDPAASTFSIQVKPSNDKPAVSAPSKPVIVDSQNAANNLAPGFSVSDVDISDLQPGEADLLTVIIRVTDANGKPLTSVDAGGNYTLSITDQHGNTLSAVSTGTAAGYLQLTGSRQEINDALKTLGVGFDQDGNAKFKLQVIVDDRLNASGDGYQNGGVGVTANGGEQNRQDKQELKNIDSKVYDWTSALIQGDTSFNLNVASVDLWVSTVNEAPKITSTPSSPLEIYEDVETKLEGIQFSDAESSTFGTSVHATFTVNSGTLDARSVPEGIELTKTPNPDGSFTITLKGDVTKINAFLSSVDNDTGLFYTPVTEQSRDTNGADAGDVSLTITLDEDASNIGGDTGNGSTAAVKVEHTVAITILAANDAPTASGTGGTIIITEPTVAQAIPGFSIADTLDATFDADGECDEVQVTVRLLDSQGQPLLKTAYEGVTLSIAGGATGLATGGVNGVLVLRGTVAQVNAALAQLQITLENEPEKGLGNADTPYQIQIIVDDRLRNADGSLKIEDGKASANGGDKNNTLPGSNAETVDIPTTEIDPYVDSAFGNYALNVDTAERTIWPSSENEPPVIERDPPNVTLNEDERTFIGEGFTVTDAESDNFGLPVRITVDIGDKGILSVGGTGVQSTISVVVGDKTFEVKVTGDESGKLVLEGTASAISALLNDPTNGLFFTSKPNDNADHNGSGSGDITVKLTVDEHESASAFPGTTKNPNVESAFYITVNPVNDAPVIGGTSNTKTHDLYPDRGGNGWHWTTGPDDHDSGADKPSHAPINLISNATVTDVDLDKTLNDTGADSFGGGSITVRMNDPVTGDVLSVVGTMPGIQQVSGGSNGQPLVITLSDDASAAQVVAILNAIQFDNDGDPTASGAHLNRDFTIVLNDGNNSNSNGNAGSGGAKDSNTLTGSLKFARYEAPVTVADTGSASSTSPTATGNVLNNDSDKVLVSDSTQTGKPELNVSLINTGGSATGGTAVVLGSNNEGTTVQGTYGTLTIKPDGSYTYTLDPTRPAYVLLGNQTEPETFTYRATDAQLLSSDSTLTIHVTGVDDPVTVVVNPGNTTSHTVYESHLADGSAAMKDPSQLGVESRFTVSAPDGLKEEITLGFTNPDGTAGSITLSKSQLEAINTSPSAPISTPYGELVLTGYTVDLTSNTATVDYRYTLKTAPAVTGENTPDVFTITASDLKSGNHTGSSTIAITIVDDVPSAIDDTNHITEDTPASAPATGNVLGGTGISAGDKTDTLGADGATVSQVTSGSESAPISATAPAILDGQYGTLTLHADGRYSYVLDNSNLTVQGLGPNDPPLTEIYSYSITDGDGNTATATLTISISGNDDGVTVQVPDTDNEPQPSAPDGNTSDHVVFESGLSNGSTPNVNDTLVNASFTITALDGVGTVTIGLKDGTQITLTQAELEALSPTAPASHKGFDTTYGRLELTGYTQAADGTITVSYTYTLTSAPHNASASANLVKESFTVSVSDRDGDTNTPMAEFSITIVDDAPTAEDDAATLDRKMNEANGNVMGSGGHKAPGFGDMADRLGADGSELTEISAGGVKVYDDTITSGPPYRDVSRDYDVTINGVTYGPGDVLPTAQPDGTGVITITDPFGTLVIAKDGSYTFTRDAAQKLAIIREYLYTIVDQDGDPSTATLTIYVENRSPIITDQGVPVENGGLLTPSGSVSESGLASGSATDKTVASTTGVITFTPGDGKSDITLTFGSNVLVIKDDATITSGSHTLETEYGTVTITSYDPAKGKLEYIYTLTQPFDGNNGSDGTDTFQVKIDGEYLEADGVTPEAEAERTTTATVQITIKDDAPQAVADTNTIAEDSESTSGNVLGGSGTSAGDQTDIRGADTDALVVVGTQAGAGTPGESVTGNVGKEVSGQYGTLVLNANGEYTYTLDNTDPRVQALKVGETFTEVFTYTIEDGDGSRSTTTLTITIQGTNDIPTLTPPGTSGVTPGNPSVNESGLPDGSHPDSGSNKTTGTLEINSPEGVSTVTVTPPGGNPVTLTPGQAETIETPSGKVTVTYTPGHGSEKPFISWTYELTEQADHGGSVPPTDSFTITVTDGDGDPSSPSTITIDIVDDKPVAQDDRHSTLVNVPITGDLSSNDMPGADGPVTWTPEQPPAHGSVTIDPVTGQYTYTPEPGFIGTDTFTYTVTDKDGSTSTATVTITVTNQPPIAVDDSNVSEPGKPATGNVLTGGSAGDKPDSDPDGQPITVTEITVEGITVQIPPDQSVTVDIPGKGTLVIGSDGSYTFTPIPLWGGQVPDISYTISDGAGGTDTAILRITITTIPTASDVPPRLPAEIPSFANQGERPLYDMRGQTPWSGNQFYFPSVFWENPGFGTSSLFPQPFHPVVYVLDEVQRAQDMQQTHPIDSQWPTWFAQDHNGLRSASTYLGMDPALFVQHAVRQVQWMHRLHEFLARNMQTNLPMESPSQSAPNASPAPSTDALDAPVVPSSGEPAPTDATATDAAPPASAALRNESFGELLARWSTAPEPASDSETVSQSPDIKSRSFSEQLQQSAHQLPSHLS